MHTKADLAVTLPLLCVLNLLSVPLLLHYTNVLRRM